MCAVIGMGGTGRRKVGTSMTMIILTVVVAGEVAVGAVVAGVLLAVLLVSFVCLNNPMAVVLMFDLAGSKSGKGNAFYDTAREGYRTAR